MFKKIFDFVYSIRYFVLAFILGAIFAGSGIFYFANRSSSAIIEGLRGKVTELGTNLDKLRDNYTNLGKIKDGLIDTNRQLNEELGRRQATVEKLKLTNSKLDIELGKRESIISGLEATNSELERANRERQAFIEGLGKSVSEFGSGVESAKDDVSKLKIYLRFVSDTIQRITSVISNPSYTK